MIDETGIPLHNELIEAAKALGTHPLAWAFYGGEDFQLVGTVPSSLAEDIKKHPQIHCIGRVVAGIGEVWLTTADGKEELVEAKGYDHLKRSDGNDNYCFSE